MLPFQFLTIPDRAAIAIKAAGTPMRASQIRAALLHRDGSAPTEGAIRTTLARSPAFRRVGRGRYVLREAGDR